MAARPVLQAFEKFQKERLIFVTSISELAKVPQNVEYLERAGALGILKTLLLDIVPSIQHSAAVALGRLAHSADRLAEAVVELEILPLLVRSIETGGAHYQKAASYCLRAVARHSPALAQRVVEHGAVSPLVSCLDSHDPAVKEAAAWTLGYIASHKPDLAQNITDAGVIPLLLHCLQEPETSLQRISLSALSDIAKHSPDLAQLVVDMEGVPLMAKLIATQETKLRRQVFSCLSNIARHSAELAEVVVETGIFPKMLTSLKFPDDGVRKNAAILIREVCKHSPELAQLVVSHGSVAALVDHIAEGEGGGISTASQRPILNGVYCGGHFRLPSLMAIGFISAFSETLSATVIAENGVRVVGDVVRGETEDIMKSAAIWTMGQIGKHTSEHSKAVAETGILLHCIDLEKDDESSEELKNRCRQTIKAVVSRLTHLPSLDALVHKRVEDGAMQIVLEQLAKALEHDPQGRSQFVHTGGLALLQEIAEAPDSSLSEVVDAINQQYPEEIVMHYSPSYSQKLLEKLDAQATQTVS